MAVVYKPGAAADIARRMFRFHLPFAALPNILAGRFAVPEFLLSEATADNLSLALRRILQDDALRNRMRAVFADLRTMLARNGSKEVAGRVGVMGGVGEVGGVGVGVL